MNQKEKNLLSTYQTNRPRLLLPLGHIDQVKAVYMGKRRQNFINSETVTISSKLILVDSSGGIESIKTEFTVIGV